MPHVFRATLSLSVLAMLAACAATGPSSGDDAGESDASSDEDADTDAQGPDSGTDVGIDWQVDPDAAPADVAIDSAIDSSGTDVSLDAPDALAFVSSPPIRVTEGESYEYAWELNFGDGVEVELVEGPDGAVLNGESVAWSVPLDFSPENSPFNLVARRDGSLSAEQRFEVQVDYYPEFRSTPSEEALVGLLYAETLVVRDDNGDAGAPELVAGPEWLRFDDGVLRGVPDATGSFDVNVQVRDGAGLEATLGWTISVSAPVVDVRVSRPFVESVGDQIEVVGCCFDGDEIIQVGGVPLATTIVNAARATAETSALRVGDAQLEIVREGRVIGGSADPVLVLPAVLVSEEEGVVEVEVDASDVSTLALGGFDTDRRLFSHRPFARNAESWFFETEGRGALQVIADDVASLPFAGPREGRAAILDVEPALHAPGTDVVVTTAGLDSGSEVRLRWADVSRSAIVVDGAVSALVPAGASGRLSVELADTTLPSFAAGYASSGTLPTIPEVTWCNRGVLRSGRENVVLCRGIGFANPSAEWLVDNGSARLLWIDEGGDTLALAVSPEPGIVSVTLQIGGRAAQPVHFLARAGLVEAGLNTRVSGPGVGVGSEAAGIGLGPWIRVGTAQVAGTPFGLWVTDETDGSSYGVDIDGGWSRLSQGFIGSDAGVRALWALADVVYVLLADGRVGTLHPDEGWQELVRGGQMALPDFPRPVRHTSMRDLADVYPAHGGFVGVRVGSTIDVFAVATESDVSLLGTTISMGEIRSVGSIDEFATSARVALAVDCLHVLTERTWFEVDTATGALLATRRIATDSFTPAGASPSELGGGIEDVAFADGELAFVDASGTVFTFSAPDGCPVEDAEAQVVGASGPARGWLSRVDGRWFVSGDGMVREADAETEISASSALIGRINGWGFADDQLIVSDGQVAARIDDSGVVVDVLARNGALAGTSDGIVFSRAGTDGMDLELDTDIASELGALASGTGASLVVSTDARVVGGGSGASWMVDQTGVAVSDSETLFVGGGGAESAGPVAVSEAELTNARSAAIDGDLLWVAAEEGLWRVTDEGSGVAERVFSSGARSSVACADGLPARAWTGVVSFDAGLLLLSDSGELWLAERSGTRIGRTCVIGTWPMVARTAMWSFEGDGHILGVSHDRGWGLAVDLD